MTDDFVAKSCRVLLDARPLTLTTKDIGSMFSLFKSPWAYLFFLSNLFRIIWLIAWFIALNIVVSLWTDCKAFSGCDPPIEKHRYKPPIVHISPFTSAFLAWWVGEYKATSHFLVKVKGWEVCQTLPILCCLQAVFILSLRLILSSINIYVPAGLEAPTNHFVFINASFSY